MPLAPGTGVFVPNMAPHWVIAGPDVSVSLSVSWRSVVLNELASVTRLNHRLRGYGLSPRPYGASKPADRTKLAVLRVGQATRPIRHTISAARSVVKPAVTCGFSVNLLGRLSNPPDLSKA